MSAWLRASGSVWAEEEARLILDAGGTTSELEDLIARRRSGEPLETVLGWVDFHGHRLVVRPGVFVPRRRTELLARLAAERLVPDGVVVELCCGVAPVAAVLAGRGDSAEVHAADLSEVALACARLNAPTAHLHCGDLYAALPSDLWGRVDMLVANAPYVPTAAIAGMPPEARDHEPALALDGGPDGVEVHRRIAGEAAQWLRPGGVLLVETSRAQAAKTARTMAAVGLVTDVARDDNVDATVAVGLRAVGPV